MNILVAVPAYNCESQIARVIQQFRGSPRSPFAKLLIIDNCSTDNTLQTALNAVKDHDSSDISIIQNEENYNLGGTHKVAFQYCIDEGFDGVTILHGDDQGRLRDIEGPLTSPDVHSYDCILGARFMKYAKLTGYPIIRILGNKIFNLAYSLCVGRKIFDMGSGLNFFSRNLILESLHHKMPDDLTFNNAYLLTVITAKKKIKFVPISWREEDQVSNAKLWSASVKLIGYLYKFLFHREKFLTSDFRVWSRQSYNFNRIK
jgi:glycosyltransferase involved in cell wall biosynthesis